jgi:AcrR family transcriptional regulator
MSEVQTASEPSISHAPDPQPVVVPVPNSERSAATRSKLIVATIDCLYRYGYAATSTTLVARTAQVSRGAMLHHYPSKVCLMEACMVATFERELAYYRHHLLPISDPVERMEKLLDCAWSCFSSPSGVARTEVWMATRSDPELAARLLPIYQIDSVRSDRSIVHLMAEAGIDDVDFAKSFAVLAISALRGLALAAALGTPEIELKRSVDLIKADFLAKVSATRAASRL